MNSFAKRMGSLLLCLMLLTSMLPVNAIAEALEPATPAEATEKTDEFDEVKSEEACAHTQAVSSVDEERSYWPIGDEQHSVTVLQHEVCICPDCGEVLKDESVEIDAYAEEHAYNDEGICSICGHAISFESIMPLSLDLDISEEEPTKAMSIYVDAIVVGQSFSFSWDEVPYADHYEVSIVRIDQNNQEHHITGSSDVKYRQNVGTSRSFTVSAADMAADTKRIRIYVGAASAAFPCPAEEMIKDITTTVDARYEENKEMDVAVSVNGSTAVVDWPAVDGADHYTYKVLDNEQNLIPETETTGLNFRIDDLLSGHWYKIWVAAYDANGEVIVQHASESKLLLICDHALTMDVDLGGRYGNISADTHTLYGLFDIQCKSCGEVLQKDQIKNLGTEAHQFTGDVCELCGYDRSAQDVALVLTVGEAISGKPLTVSWNEIAGADHYQYSARDLTTDTALCNETTAGTTFTLEGASVAADHEYKLWAAAFDADGLMLTQATSQVTATKPEVKLVLNVGAAVGGQTLIATWNEVEDADHYQYNIRNLSTDTPIWGEKGQSTQIPSLMLNGILVDDNVEYKIWVGAFDASGTMMAQVTQTVKTSAAQSNPMNLSYSGTPLAGIDLAMAWSKLTDAVRYEYSLRDVTTNTSIYSREKTEAAYFTIPGAKLEANHSYRFWVGAIGESGAEPDGNHQGSVSFTVVQCPHGSAARKNEAATRTSISDTQHHVVTTYDLYCTYCDTVLEKGKTEEYDEKHSLDEAGDCTLCDYRAACKHENTKKEYKDTAYTVLADGKHHRVTDIYRLVCADCGKVIIELDSSLNETHEEEHSFEGDVCTRCGYARADQFSVTIKLDQQTAQCGDMLGAEAVVAGGSGSYSYYWEVYCDGQKVNSTTDAGKRYTYTADNSGEWKFVLVVTDKAEDDNFWAESALVKVEHALTTEEITDKRRIERNWNDDANTHTVIKTLHTFCKCGKTDEITEVREQEKHVKDAGRFSYEADHPHKKFYICPGCGIHMVSDGETRSESDCSICNPPKQDHTNTNHTNNTNEGNQNNEHQHVFAIGEPQKEHPHQAYGYCECGEKTVVYTQSLSCCVCVGHQWGSIYRLDDRKTYQQKCGVCGATEEVEPPTNLKEFQEIADLFYWESDRVELYKKLSLQESASNRVWKIVAGQATDKLMDVNFVVGTETLNVFGDMMNSVKNEFFIEEKDWNEQKVDYWRNLLIDLLRKKSSESKKNWEEIGNISGDLSNYAEMFEDIESGIAGSLKEEGDELEKTLKDLKDWINELDIDSKSPVKVGDSIDLNKFDENSEMIRKKLELEKLRDEIDETINKKGKYQNAAEVETDLFKTIGVAMNAMEILSAGNSEAQKVSERNKAFADLVINGGDNLRILEEIAKTAQKTGDTNLYKAAIDVRDELEKEWTEQTNSFLTESAAFLKGSSEKLGEKLVEGLVDMAIEKGGETALGVFGAGVKDSLAILGAIETGAKVGKMVLNWDPAYQQAQVVMTYASMDGEMNIMQTLSESSSPYMVELWKQLQVQGCQEASKFLETWDKANFVDIKEFIGKMSLATAQNSLKSEEKYYMDSMVSSLSRMERIDEKKQ